MPKFKALRLDSQSRARYGFGSDTTRQARMSGILPHRQQGQQRPDRNG
ncbi:MAG: hypothetical protein LBE86_07625 [Gemmobacter sp.]|jgi:hypothetical protein|nr:hypothetical protein [Gemmobacter sp.]